MNKKLRNLFALMFFLGTFVGTFYWSGSESTIKRFMASANEEEVQKLVDELVSLRGQLNERIQNTHGKQISKFDSPTDVMNVVRGFKAHVEGLGSEFDEVKNSTIVRDFYIQAAVVLIRGRGEHPRGSRNGWFMSNSRGDNGVQELKEFINMGVFDQEALSVINKAIQDTDFEDPGTRMSMGFPPEAPFVLNDQQVKSDLSSALKNQRPRADYDELSLEKAKKILGLLGPTAPKHLVDFIDSLDKNLYDESVDVLNSPEDDFVDYYGRETEFRKTVETLMRTEKSHIIYTGKAGVGKTTILKMLQDAFVQGHISIAEGEESPIILELPITDVTNQTDPTLIKVKVARAKELSQKLNRRVIIYVDEAHVASTMTKNALKSFLTELTDGKEKVHAIFSTTSGESRSFLDDTAFNRRFNEIHVREFSEDESIELVKLSHLPRWRNVHRGLEEISEDAFKFAARHYKLEQPNAGNPTGIKEFLEGAITHKREELRIQGLQGEGFVLELDDLRNYLKFNRDVELVPGDPGFNHKFEVMWNQLEEKYVGQEGFKHDVKDELRKFFQTLEPRKMPTWVLHGPPGAGKTYFSEVLADTYFKGSILKINAAEYKEGGLALNKLIGSPTGTVGSEEQRSILSKFIKDNPHGGVIVIEEADYLHKDVIELFTNMITDKEFMDGLGIVHDTSRFVIQMNTNIGQDYLVPSDARVKMNWEQYDTRRANLVTSKIVDGETVEIVQKNKILSAFEEFIRKIVEKSMSSGEDMGGAAAQETQKQKRRMKPYYLLGPTKDELRAAAQTTVDKFKASMDIDYGIKVKISDDVIERVIRIEEFEFEKGYSYIQERLEDKIFDYVLGFSSNKDAEIVVELDEGTIEFNGRTLETQKLNLLVDGESHVFDLGAIATQYDNPWLLNKNMGSRIKSFARKMGEHLYGSSKEIQKMKSLLKLKRSNWDTRVVMSLLGTTGNGKTEFFKSVAKVLFGDGSGDDAIFIIPELKGKYALNSYIRPPTGVLGSTEETEFEKWFKNRQRAGGGVILFDELLSFQGLNGDALGGKIGIINELYSLFDEGFINIGSKKYDARGFVIGITGNSLKEIFHGIEEGPEAERLIKEITDKLTFDDIAKYFEKYGVGQEKLVRFGEMIVKGPLPKEAVVEITHMKSEKLVKEIVKRLGRDIEVKIADDVVDFIATELTTITGGMRLVEGGLRKTVLEPIGGMITDFSDEEAVHKIEVAKDGDKLVWRVNDKDVVLEGVPFGKNGEEELNWVFKSDMEEGSFDRTPDLAGLRKKKPILDEEAKIVTTIHEVYGHWMVDVLFKRKNPTSFISVTPSSNALGYVRSKQDKVIRETGLTTILERILVLQAGHRAPMREGFFSAGGGNAKRDKKTPTDDLGKINDQIDQILSNHLLDINEHSSKEEQRMMKSFILEVSKRVVDDVIGLGIDSGEFEGVYNTVLEQGFIEEEKLDDFVEKVDFDKKFSNFYQEVFSSFVKHAEGSKGELADDKVNDFLARVNVEMKRRFGVEIDTNLDDCIKGLNFLL